MRRITFSYRHYTGCGHYYRFGEESVRGLTSPLEEPVTIFRNLFWIEKSLLDFLEVLYDQGTEAIDFYRTHIWLGPYT